WSVIQTTDTGYLLGGYSGSGISGDKTEASQGGYADYWVVKLDASGNIQWQNTIGGNDWDELHSVIQTTDGGFFLGGSSYSDLSGDKTEANDWGRDYWVVKLDGSGNIEWQNTIGTGGYSDDFLISVIQTTDGGYLLGGYSNYFGYYFTGWVVKLEGLGNVQWENTFYANYYNYLVSVIQANDGGYLLGGYSDTGIFGDYDYWVVKLFADTCIGCPLPTSLSVVNITSTTASLLWDAVPGAMGYRVKYKAAGTSQWTLIASTDNEEAIIGLTPNTEYRWQVRSVCSRSPVIYSDSSAQDKFTTVPLRLGASESKTAFEIYPNPFSSSTTISFSVPQDSRIQIELLDIAGRKLRTLLDENVDAGYSALSAGKHEIKLNRDQLSAGIYFIKFLLGGVVMMKKVVIE
ncbi:MAG: T9SS type A sorting domain-containing protein, partial [Chitinophagales bacterium]